MKRILTIMLNGDAMPSLLYVCSFMTIHLRSQAYISGRIVKLETLVRMHIIRFVMPSKSKHLKKLLYFYYEICPKLDAGGKLKQEMILVW